jgi:hypothetical protein
MMLTQPTKSNCNVVHSIYFYAGKGHSIWKATEILKPEDSKPIFLRSAKLDAVNWSWLSISQHS